LIEAGRIVQVGLNGVDRPAAAEGCSYRRFICSDGASWEGIAFFLNRAPRLPAATGDA